MTPRPSRILAICAKHWMGSNDVVAVMLLHWSLFPGHFLGFVDHAAATCVAIA